MALLPARRNGTLSRPGSQAPGRWDPFAEFEDLYQRMGSGEFRESGAGTQGRALRRGRRSGRFEYRVLLPGHAETDKVTAAWPTVC
jgi:hypothetical protein